MIDGNSDSEQGILNLTVVLFVGATIITGCVLYSLVKRAAYYWCVQGERLGCEMWWGRLL